MKNGGNKATLWINFNKGSLIQQPSSFQSSYTREFNQRVMTVEPTLYLRGYSSTFPIMENGEYTGRHRPRVVPDGCRSLDEPYFAICASKRIELWLVWEEPGEEEWRCALLSAPKPWKPKIIGRNLSMSWGYLKNWGATGVEEEHARRKQATRLSLFE